MSPFPLEFVFQIAQKNQIIISSYFNKFFVLIVNTFFWLYVYNLRFNLRIKTGVKQDAKQKRWYSRNKRQRI